jgi:hypothetical protein
MSHRQITDVAQGRKAFSSDKVWNADGTAAASIYQAGTMRPRSEGEDTERRERVRDYIELMKAAQARWFSARLSHCVAPCD